MDAVRCWQGVVSRVVVCGGDDDGDALYGASIVVGDVDSVTAVDVVEA